MTSILQKVHFKTVKRPTSVALYFLVLCLAIQAIIPLGFMPTSIQLGIFQICPVQQPDLYQSLSHQHHHDSTSHDSHQLQPSNDCQWGQSIAALTAFFVFCFRSIKASQAVTVLVAVLTFFIRYSPPIRAPPRPA